MQQQAAALHMAQKVVTKAHALAGALDQARDICADKAGALAHRDNAQSGHQGGKVVVRDLRLSRTDHRNQRGLADIGEPDQAHIRDQFQLQGHLQILAGHTRLCKFGHLTGGAGKMRIAAAAPAALCHSDRCVVGQVCNDQTRSRILDDRAQRHLDDQIFGICTVAQPGTALAAFGCSILALIAEVHQRAEVIIHHKDDVAALAAVAAVRAACGHELFTMEADRAVAALAGMEPDGGDIDKVGLCCHTAPPFLRKKSRATRVRLFQLQFFTRSYCLTLHFLPVLPTRSKRTVPSTRANRVSSLPLPTFSPGWMWVPR